MAVKRFLGGFDEAGFLAEDAAADQALSGVDPREAARRATDPINAIDIAAAGGFATLCCSGLGLLEAGLSVDCIAASAAAAAVVESCRLLRGGPPVCRPLLNAPCCG